MNTDAALLRALEEEIPVLEEKLRAMKVTRQRLKSAERMRAKRKDPEFNAKALAATLQRINTPEERERWLRVRNANNPLPFPPTSDERKLYNKLRVNGLTREQAIQQIGGA